MCNNNNEIKAKEFFVFSYFNILPADLFKKKKGKFDEFNSYEEYVAYKCAYRAYLDVCRTIKYSVTTTEIEQDKKKYDGYMDLKKAFIDYEINLILTQINNIQNTKEDFDKWHNSLCNKMLIDNNNFKQKLNTNADIELLFKANKNGKDENSFKYGMVQKWLNMTIKNILLLNDMYNDNITGYDLNKYKHLFHVPVDKNILKAAKDLGITKKNGKSYSIEGWSNWNDKTYQNFTDALNKKIKEKFPYQCPLDWEHTVWMEFTE